MPDARPTSRRVFLHAAGSGAAVVTVAACSAPSTAPPATPPATAPPAGPAGSGGGALPAAATDVMRGPRYALSRWFAYLADRATGAPLYDLNGGDLVLPASTTKLWSTAAALDTFGPDFRFETPVYRRGTTAGDQLTGDLVLVASGDLTMGGRDLPDGTIAFTPLDHGEANAIPGASLTAPDPLAGLDDLARQVAAAGIRRVVGDVVVDARLFDQTDKDGYVLTPTMINDNLVDVTLTPGAAGTPATAVVRPQSAAYPVRSTVTTVAAGQPPTVTASLDAGGITVSGQVPAGPPVLRTAQVPDPPAFARTLFIEALGRAGVAVTAAAGGANPAATLPPPGSYPAADRVAVHRSLPFAQNIKLINKVSMNVQADTLVMLIAAHGGKRTLDDGMALLAPFVRTAGIDPASLSLSDGRGNEYTDLFSPRTVTTLLRYMATRPDFPAYHASLPVFGVDGTESTVVPAGSPVAGKVAAKSGTTVAGDVMNARALVMTRGNAGYMTSRSGRELVVAVYVMHTPIGAIEDVFGIARDVGSVVTALWEAG
ncbi:MAG TPA: D-alanyl-D-alanine carboxypeptidase/D-alanyl-D-alanine-endopeptidase [Pseudonocardia sp.]|jgi:D-alanyl-D-alanine carboxypeptidase/D-alanyl-D-alanine-endopeptidase (penicillin-binding protein 4)